MAFRPSAPIVQDDKKEAKKLFDLAIHAEWDKIVDMYENNPDAHTTKITTSGDSALHLAVQGGKEEYVMKLVDSIVTSHPTDKLVEVLGLKNDRGDTPLHFAASMGNLLMCYVLANSSQTSHELIGLRNAKGETPLFVAAANGEKIAFLCLYSLIPEAGREETGMSYGKRANGDTVLHCALDGDYLDLAFQIIHRFPGLGNRVNEHGCSPLHLLASNPSAFRSGSRFGIIDTIIYNCIFVTVDPEETSNFDFLTQTVRPENYLVCVHFYDFFLGLFESLGRRRSTAADTESQAPVHQTNQAAVPARQRNQVLLQNHDVIFDFLKIIFKAMFIILGVGPGKIENILEKKKKHTWSLQIMKKLLKESCGHQYYNNGQKPGNLHLNEDGGTAPYVFDPEELLSEDAGQKENGGEPNSSTASSQSNEIGAAHDKEKRCLEVFQVAVTDKEIDRNKMLLLAVDGAGGETKKETPILIAAKKEETPILIAAKNGIIEMVQGIYDKFPLAINDINADHKNIVLLAVENRQTDVYNKLLWYLLKDNDGAFRKVDKEGNSALHLAAGLGGHRPWLIPGAALQMQWELKWYEFVKNSKPADIFPKYNKNGQTARDIFTETHESLVEKGSQWLTTTSQSCSVVAALIATVAFATATAVPGGVDESKGTPTLEKQPAFDIFAIAALVALSLSVTSLVMFLAILTSRFEETDFRISLPRKLLLGLTSLFLAIVAMLVSFCAGHFFVLKDDLKYKAIFVYAVTCLPITVFYVIVQFPLYCDLVWATMSKVPRRSYKVNMS